MSLSNWSACMQCKFNSNAKWNGNIARNSIFHKHHYITTVRHRYSMHTAQHSTAQSQSLHIHIYSSDGAESPRNHPILFLSYANNFIRRFTYVNLLKFIIINIVVPVFRHHMKIPQHKAWSPNCLWFWLMGHKLWHYFRFEMFSETCVNQFVFVCFIARWVAKLEYIWSEVECKRYWTNYIGIFIVLDSTGISNRFIWQNIEFMSTHWIVLFAAF